MYTKKQIEEHLNKTGTDFEQNYIAHSIQFSVIDGKPLVYIKVNGQVTCYVFLHGNWEQHHCEGVD